MFGRGFILKIAYLGDTTSFSYAAAVECTTGDYVGYPTITSAITAVARGDADECVVPIENNTEGSVNETVDGQWQNDLFINSQYVLPIKHNLIAKQGVRYEDVTRIVSHAQAIGQCHEFLLKAEGVRVEAVSSTSVALTLIDDHTAAIARLAPPGAVVLKADIADSANNATRFVRLSKTPTFSGDCASIMCVLKNKPGALKELLDAFYALNINLTRIVSRPFRSGNGEYRFFIDFVFAGLKDELEPILENLARHVETLKFLGAYKP